MEYQICSENDLANMVQEYGSLYLLKNKIPSVSVEEHTPPEYWFAKNVDGPLGVERTSNPKDRLRLWEVFRRESGFYQPGMVL